MPGGLHPTIEIFLKWPKPNYIDPVTKPKYVLVLACILGPISLAMLLVRFWVRLRIQQNPGWDDWLMLASWFPTIALTFIFPWSKCFPERHEPTKETDTCQPLKGFNLVDICGISNSEISTPSNDTMSWRSTFSSPWDLV
jgi:hypothetical protein